MPLVKVRATSGAGLYDSAPACDAVIVQEPAPAMCTVTPAIEQSPVAVNDTARPELALAATSKSPSPSPYVLSPSSPNVIVWSALPISNDRSTFSAAS